MYLENMKFDFIAIDFETANGNMSSACSVGIVAVRGHEIIDQAHYFIKPPIENFSSKNIELHGITYDDVKDCDQFPEIWEKIKHYFVGNIIVAHNAQFDMSVLHGCLSTYGIECPNFIYMDSISISSMPIDEYIGSSLAERAAYFNIDIGNHHNAADDAVTAAKLVVESMKRLNMPSLTWLAILNNISAKQFCNLKPNKSFVSKSNKFAHVKISELVCNNINLDTDHPLYAKNCVLTGELKSMDRAAAMQKIIDAGGIIKSGVSGKTDYLIVGEQDITLVGDDGLSSKEEKAYAFIEKGADIKIINEVEFLELL